MHLGIDRQQVGDATGVIGVAVRDDRKINIPQVDSQRFHIVFEDPGIVPRVEQDALAPVLHQSCETPIHGQRGRFAERVIQNSDAIWRLCGSHSREPQNNDRQGG